MCALLSNLPAFQLAKAGARCDYTLYAGATEDNHGSVHKLANQVFTLKMYLNETFNALHMSSVTYWMKVRATMFNNEVDSER